MTLPLVESVAHLVVLIGHNPLPNYVSALCLSKPGSTAITLVHSDGTTAQRDVLADLFGQCGFRDVRSLRVEEANSSHIYNQMRTLALPSDQPVILDYTGGTKAMSVHAHRALHERTALAPYQGGLSHMRFCYLDARTLSLRIEDSLGAQIAELPAGAAVRVDLMTMLRLHGMSDLRRAMRSEPIWGPAAAELARLHTDPEDANEWRSFCERHLRDGKNRLIRLAKLSSLSTDAFPLAARHVAEALANGTPLPLTLGSVAEAAGFARSSDDFARWLDGSWLEHYVLAAIHSMSDAAQIHDAAITINPLHKEPVAGRRLDFEFDVAFVRGYQLFALSCTSSSQRDRCKAKLLEAVVRAQQLGGAEARVGLVCCNDKPDTLQAEVSQLLGERVRVFGRADLLPISERLLAWVTDPSRSGTSARSR